MDVSSKLSIEISSGLAYTGLRFESSMLDIAAFGMVNFWRLYAVKYRAY